MVANFFSIRCIRLSTLLLVLASLWLSPSASSAQTTCVRLGGTCTKGIECCQEHLTCAVHPPLYPGKTGMCCRTAQGVCTDTVQCCQPQECTNGVCCRVAGKGCTSDAQCCASMKCHMETLKCVAGQK